MSWQHWAEELRENPVQAVTDLLRGAANVGPYERAAPHEFLLAVLPLTCRAEHVERLGERRAATIGFDSTIGLASFLDTGLAAWLTTQRDARLPSARKLSAYAAQVCEALQWPLYFALPQSQAVLRAGRSQWLQWLASLTLSAFRDPEYDYWQAQAAHQANDELQFFWQSFVVEAGRTRSNRYLNLGLLALANLPLSVDDGLRNLRLQVQSLVNRYDRRKRSGTAGLKELAQSLQGVMARNPSLSAANYRAFVISLLAPLGEDKTASVLSLTGLSTASGQRQVTARESAAYKLKPPGLADETDLVVQAVRNAGSLAQAWNAIRPLLRAHEEFVHKSGDAYYFVRNLDRCARALCDRYSLRDPEIQNTLFQWIHMALRMDADNPRLWMLWELALRKTDHPQRAQWVLWEMTRRFPEQLPCRVELARLLAASANADDQFQANRLLHKVLQLDPENLHALSTLAQLAIRRNDWPDAIVHAQRGLQVAPDNSASAVLLAAAYARRNKSGDLQMSLEHLKRFVSRYPGNLKAEEYLRVLTQRQPSAAQNSSLTFDEDESAVMAEVFFPETDPAWLAFSASLRVFDEASKSEAADPISAVDPRAAARVMPLPLGLRHAVTLNQWDTDVLDQYDPTVQQQFPLETRLWRYLQALQADAAGGGERDRVKDDVQSWLDAEVQSGESWAQYLNQQWLALNASADTALKVGSDWLKDLLDRYQPLPAPLFA